MHDLAEGGVADAVFLVYESRMAFNRSQLEGA